MTLWQAEELRALEARIVRAIDPIWNRPFAPWDPGDGTARPPPGTVTPDQIRAICAREIEDAVREGTSPEVAEKARSGCEKGIEELVSRTRRLRCDCRYRR